MVDDGDVDEDAEKVFDVLNFLVLLLVDEHDADDDDEADDNDDESLVLSWMFNSANFFN